VIAIVIAVVLLFFWLIRRNQKDEKKFEKDTIQSELKPEKEKDSEPGI
jgi:preprotein translocase subunit YajC